MVGGICDLFELVKEVGVKCFVYMSVFGMSEVIKDLVLYYGVKW